MLLLASLVLMALVPLVLTPMTHNMQCSDIISDLGRHGQPGTNLTAAEITFQRAAWCASRRLGAHMVLLIGMSTSKER